MPFYEVIDGKTVVKTNVGLTQLHEAPGDESNSKTWFLNQATFWSASSASVCRSESELVRAGTPTDLASVPRFMWGVVPSYGRHTMPALVHDRGCIVARGKAVTRRRLRREADNLLRRSLASFAGMGVARRWLMWSAVRLFGAPAVAAFAVLTPLLIYAWVGYYFLRPEEESELLRSAGFLLAGATVTCAAVLVLLVVSMGLEDSTNDTDALVGRRFRWSAMGSMLGAVVIGLVAAGPLVPLVAVTVATNTVIWALDVLLWLPGAAWRMVEKLTRLAPQADDEESDAGVETQPAAVDRSEQAPRLRFFPGP